MASRGTACAAAIAAITVLMASCQQNTVKYETFQTKIDHFNAGANETFNLRYAMSEQHWDKNGGPIFIHTANEGSIEDHVKEMGIMWEWAQEFKALLVFVEHRYFGKSMPFGDDSFKDSNKMALLTTEQALADYASLIMWLRRNKQGAGESRIATFGCGYAGLNAVWMRTRYPYLIQVVLASGAPLKMTMYDLPCNLYFEQVTKAYDASSPGCAMEVRRIWPILTRLGSTDQGRSSLQQKFHLCDPLNEGNVQDFEDWVRDSYIGLAFVNYPHASDQTPANPVKMACEKLAPKDDDGTINAAVEAVGYFRNRTGAATCYSLAQSQDRALEYQKCTEFVQPICGDGVTDMFKRTKWDFNEFSEKCNTKFGIEAPKVKLLENMAGHNLCGVILTVLSVGDMDPWLPYCVHTLFKPHTDVHKIAGAAHCQDLRFQHADSDLQSVKDARDRTKTRIHEWLMNSSIIFPVG